MSKTESGFTLVELLIAMTLLSMIMLLGTWSFSTFTSRWEGRLGYFAKHVSQSKDYILLSDVISSISPYLYNSNKRAKYYFEANNSQINAVSQSAIFNTNTPVVFKLSVETFSNGTKYLLYQEGILTPFNQDKKNILTHEKILIKEAHHISFEFFGWATISEKIISEDPLSGGSSKKPQWRNNYNSKISNLMPISIRIKWNDSILELPLINDQGHWLTLVSQSGIDNE